MNKSKQGFTLIETVIYLGIIGVVMTGFITLAMLISALKTKNLIVRETNQNARQVLGVISRRLKLSDSVNSPLPGKASTTLIITQDLQQIRYYNEEGVVRENENSVLNNLNDNKFIISNLEFTNLGSTSTPSIQIKFDINYQSQDSKEFNYSKSVQTAATLVL